MVMVVPAQAASLGLGRDDPTKFYSYISNNDGALLGYFKANMLENVFGPGGVGQQSSEDALQDIADYFNAEGNNGFVAQIKAKAAQLYDGGTLQTFYSWLAGNAPYAVVEYDRLNKISRLKDRVSGQWITNGAGEYPYYVPTGDMPAKDYDISAMAASGSWVDSRSISAVTQISLISEDALANLAVMLNKNGFNTSLALVNMNGTQYKAIRHNDGNYGKWFSTRRGAVYVTSYEPAAVNQEFNYNVGDVTQNSNNQTATSTEGAAIVGDGNKLIDLGSGKFLSPEFTLNGDINFVDQSVGEIIYDFTDNSYHLTTYDYTYNVTNNYYEYNYYTYNIQYTYNNTYVTYIGSTAEFVPTTYELYYELPDGRSSADLTAEDIAGLSFQFADMVNYKRSATDTSLRALYHFDGDTDDSSYWSTQGAFTWDKGASITYMESNAFNGALYLDEKEHQFTITLPSNIGSGDFSLQWRYYQNSATTSDHNDNYVTVGGQKLLGWSEQSLYSLGTTKLTTGLSVGTWQELALVRHNGTLYIYHNGVKVASAAMSTVFNDKIVFYLGANSRAYSMLDELRVVNFAIAKSGAAYTPTVVPYDTNSVLVLPDGSLPVADEFWKWDKTITPVKSWDFTGQQIPVVWGQSKDSVVSFKYSASPAIYSHYSSGVYVADGFYTLSETYMATSGFNPYENFLSENSDSGNIRFSTLTRSFPSIGYVTAYFPGIFLCLTDYPTSSSQFFEGNYTFTYVTADGSVYSTTFNLTKDWNTNFYAVVGPLKLQVVTSARSTFFLRALRIWISLSAGWHKTTMWSKSPCCPNLWYVSGFAGRWGSTKTPTRSLTITTSVFRSWIRNGSSLRLSGSCSTPSAERNCRRRNG